MPLALSNAHPSSSPLIAAKATLDLNAGESLARNEAFRDLRKCLDQLRIHRHDGDSQRFGECDKFAVVGRAITGLYELEYSSGVRLVLGCLGELTVPTTITRGLGV